MEIAKTLNAHGIVPTLYGSLGLYRAIGQLDEIDDIDIVVPPEYIKEKFHELVKTMEMLSYKQDKDYPHEFTKGGEKVSIEFGTNDLKEFAGIDADNLKIVEIEGIKFKELTPQDYLKFYKKALEERKLKLAKIKNKILSLEKFLN